MTATTVQTPRGSWLDVVQALIPSGTDIAGMNPAEARAMAARVARIESMLAAVRIALVRVVDQSDVPRDVGAASTGSLLAQDFGGNRGAADRLVRTAQHLSVATLTDRALAAGEVSLEQAEVISRTVAGLPDSLDEHTRLRVERSLLADARLLSVKDLRRRVMRVEDLYKPRPEVDADENARLVAQEARARAATELWMGPARDGVVHGRFAIPEVQADMLKNCLDAVAAPRRRHLEFTADDELTSGQRLGRAFCTWIEHLPTDGFPTTGGTPAVVTVNLDYDTLQDDLTAAGMLSTGTRLSASEARRLACASGILPKVLSGASLPLGLGRSKRLFTPAQRLAMAERDRGCVYPGCDRPPAWTEAHHMTHWARGGETTVDDGALGCSRHHHHIHANNIAMRLRDGVVELKIDGIWQRNHRWRP